MKIGIITFYNGNINHGGMLQAYALQKTIENLGYDCEQICLDNRITEKLSFKDKVKLVFKLKFGVFNLIKRKLYDRKINKKLFSIKQRQSEAFLEFQNLIPHTKKIYKAEEINELNDIFDEFVCGSDQVWTPYSGGIRPVPHKWNYYLEFTNKRKISYAASFGADVLPKQFEEEAVKRINNLDAISVREANAKKLISNKIHKNIQIVLDPVLLIEPDEWMKIVKKPVEEKYMLAYILGNSNQSRIIIQDASNLMKEKLITIPFIGDYNELDFKFGDIQKIDISPKEFLGYIKYSDFVITDSFHCVVFSILFEKRFVVLKRNLDKEKKAMNSRLTDLLSLVGLDDRIVDNTSSRNIQEILNRPIDYSSVLKKIEEEKIKSLEWLQNNL